MSKQKRHKAPQVSYSPLGAHTQRGKSLVPPLLNIPNVQTVSWINDRLPEMLWAALLVTGADRDIALAVFRQVSDIVHAAGIAAADVTHSGMAGWPPEARGAVLRLFVSNEQSRDALRPLLLLRALPAQRDWAEALGLAPKPTDWDALKVAVGRTLDHQSQESTDCRWVRVLAQVAAELLQLPSREMIRQLAEYPTYGDMRHVRPMIRATEGALATLPASARSWASSFWEQCWKDTECQVGLQRNSITPGPTGTTLPRVQDVRRHLASHFIESNTSTDLDSARDATFGIVAYALAILSELLRLGNSTSIIGRMALRALLECYITLSYLCWKNDSKTWEAYRNYGSGQAKLAFLKLDDPSLVSPTFVDLDTLRMLANEDRWMEFLTINVGQWDNSNLRAMSAQCHTKDEYDKYYPWTSGFTHGTWGAVRNTVFDLCLNPLHRLHRVVTPETARLDDVVASACELADKSIDLLAQRYPPFAPRVSQ